jgi:transposase
MAGRGRPTKLTEEREADLVLLLAAGVPAGLAARSVGVSERSVERWLKNGLRDRVAEARAAGQEQTDATSEARLVVLILRAAQHDWRASAWWLERRYPERERQDRPEQVDTDLPCLRNEPQIRQVARFAPRVQDASEYA